MSDLPAPGLGLAVRYRPRTFAELTGQRHVVAVLGGCIVADTVPQQLLFSGSSGLGKTTVARLCAAALLCETPLARRNAGDACGQCDSCLDITTPGRSHPDVIEFDAASHGGKDEIRDIATRAQLAPARSSRKIYIIDEAHGLSGPGGQAFLKLLEEPPAHVVFMLATTDPGKMLKTNRGRCTEFELLRPTDAELVANLARVAAGEHWSLSQDVAGAVVAATAPELGVRGTLNTLEKLAPALREGRVLTGDDVAALLGTAATDQVATLVEAIDGLDRTGAQDALDALRSRTSEEAIRAALLSWARAQFRSAAASPTGAAYEHALRRYRLVAHAGPGPVGTELLLAQLVLPQVDPSPQTLDAQLGRAEALLAELTDAVRTATAARDALAARTAPARQPPPPLAAPPPATATAPGPAPAKRASAAAAARPTPAAPAAATKPQRGTPARAGSVEPFLAALTVASGKAAALVRGCKLEMADGAIVITAAAAAHDAIRRDDIATAVRAAATATGVRVELRRT